MGENCFFYGNNNSTKPKKLAAEWQNFTQQQAAARGLVALILRYKFLNIEGLKHRGKASLGTSVTCNGSSTFVTKSQSRPGTSHRHVCIVSDERSRSSYAEAMKGARVSSMAVIVGEAEETMEGLVGVDFLVVDSMRKEFARVLRHVKLSHKGAVLACKNACGRAIYGFRWHCVLERGTRVVRSVFLYVG
ncbi:hypothetical protein V6N12_063060 [Hibiscus sabdariffa]|uniref:Uncharacterized protein n=1 Tax=Hibiscus sabdariffa TaxID=183260 RepID=A0ABR2FAL4_9ROSI